MLANYSSSAFLTASGVAVAPLATVEVRLDGPGGGALAGIYSDIDGTLPITQPGFAADSLGRFSFYVAGRLGGYQITVTRAGGGETYSVRNQAIGLGAQVDVTSYVATSLLASPDSSTFLTGLGLKLAFERAQRRARLMVAVNFS